MKKEKQKSDKVYNKLILGYLIPTLIASILCYPLLPSLLNYPPNSINNAFQLNVVPAYYWIYYVAAILLGLLTEWIYLVRKFKMIKKLEYDDNFKISDEKKHDLCSKIYGLANKSFLEMIVVPILVLAIVFIIMRLDALLTIKIISVVFIIMTVSVSIAYIYIKNKLKDLLEKLADVNKPDQFSSIMRSTYIQFIPFTIASLMIIGLVLLATFSKEYSENLYYINMHELKSEILEKNIQDEESLEQFINSKTNEQSQTKNKRTFFYVTNDNEFVNADGTKNSLMFKEYFKEYARGNGGRVYENYGVEVQGTVIFTPYSKTIQAIGYRYSIIDSNIYIILFITIALILGFNVIILYFYSISLSGEINSITEKLSNLNKEKNIGGVITITSNDEIGLLQNEYNELQGVTKGYIRELKEQQDIIVKQGQLVSIGELAGGLAHDINTPISAIKTGILMLEQMGTEKTESEKEILQRMDNCAVKIVNIVNSVRNQIRNLGGDTNIKFKIKDVINDTKVITYHEATKNKSEVIIKIIDDLEAEGDPTKLGQVITNLVVNAAQAYGSDKGGKVELTLEKAPNSMAMIKVVDYAGGLDPEIIPYIFKNMLTTKGTFGTGLGLYLAYSVIKGTFNGDITFSSEQGRGTIFYITIPIAKDKIEGSPEE